jgi:hypothetical protein
VSEGPISNRPQITNLPHEKCESFGYGRSLNVAALREVTVKMLINTLRLADDLQMTADELTAGIGMA